MKICNQKRGAFRLFVALTMLFVLIVTLIPYELFGTNVIAAETSGYGYVNVSDAVRLRQGPGTGYAVIKDMNGYEVRVWPNEKIELLETTTVNSTLWYKVRTKFNNETITGYLRGDYVQIYDGTYDSEYAAMLKDAGFPDSYLPALCYLHSLKPNWIFTPQFTGIGTSLDTSLDWETVLKEEKKISKNLLQKAASYGTPDSWYSYDPKVYNPLTDTHTAYDSGNFVQASDELIAYYLDPRHSLNEKLIYGFLDLSYNPNIHTKAGVQKIVANSFMRGALTDDPNKTYVDAFMDVAEATKVSPYLLATKILIEQGSHPEVDATKPETISKLPGNIRGTFLCADGTNLDGHYNYFNIGAYASGGRNAQENGIRFAATSPSGANTYQRPWNSVYKSLMGGGIFLFNDYIGKGQDTIYLEKYDVTGEPNVGNGLYSHQYCTAVLWVDQQAMQMRNAYKDLDSVLAFKIPVYKNMPSEIYEMPDLTGNPNNYLKSLTIDNGGFTPNYSYDTTFYSMIVSPEVDKVKVSAEAAAAPSKLKLIGDDTTGTTGKVEKEIELAYGINTIEFEVTAGNKQKRVYTISVYRKAKEDEVVPELPSPTPTPPSENPIGDPTPTNAPSPITITSKVYNLSNGYLVAVAPGNTQSQVTGNVTVAGGWSDVRKSDATTELYVGELVCTGDKLVTPIGNYTIIVNGDPSGDGKVGAKDLLMIKKYIIGLQDFTKEQALAANISGSGTIGAKDLLFAKKHILGLSTIKER